MKYFAINQISCIFVYQIKLIKTKTKNIMRTFKKANKLAIKKANEIHGFVVDNRALCILLVKVEKDYSDEYITKASI